MKIIIILLTISFILYGNEKDVDLMGDNFVPDKKLVEEYNPKAPYWVPFLETIGANLLLGSYNKYITQSDFAQISFASIEANFKEGWGWDADNFFTNMWAHPFQGSIYFNTARASGYGYWSSMLMSAIGSLHWEYFMETEHPAINDLIMTTLQGAIFGEVFYRISSMILNETTPKKRIWRELGTVGFNPARTLDRVIYGRSFRIIKSPLYETKPYRFHLLLGVNKRPQSDFNGTKERRGFLELKYFYGDILRQKEFAPMDIFILDMELQSKPEVSITKFRIYGLLWGKSFLLGSENNVKKLDSKIIFGVFHYTDYLKNDIFSVGAVNIGPGVAYLSPEFWSGSRFVINFTAAFIPMSGVNSNYAKEFVPDNFRVGRDYNLSTGISLRGRLKFTSKYVILTLVHSFWTFWTLQGAKGKELINIFEPSLAFNIYKYLKLGLGGLLYYRDGKYSDFPNIYMNDIELRAFLVLTY